MIVIGGVPKIVKTVLTVANELDFKNNNTQVLTINGGSNVTIGGGNGPSASDSFYYWGVDFVDIDPDPCVTTLGVPCSPPVIQTRINIDGAGTCFTVNDGGICKPIHLYGTDTILSLGGGTMGGSATINLMCGAVITGDNNGLLNSYVDLQGGSFMDGSAAGDVLILGGAADSNQITSSAGDDFIINGAGTIRLGNDGLIADGVDMVLNGGTFATGGYNETLTNLTLTGTSTIDLSGGTTESDLTFLGSISGGGTLAITGWSGDTAGSQTGTSIRFTSDPTAFLGSITVNGGAAATVLVGGYWYITSGGPVPEASTWLGGGGMIVIAVTHYLRRRRKQLPASLKC